MKSNTYGVDDIDDMQMHDEIPEEEDFKIPNESKISKTLSEKTTKTVIILILLMLFCLPLFQLDTYFDTVTSF
jgi:hypothetical protein